MGIGVSILSVFHFRLCSHFFFGLLLQVWNGLGAVCDLVIALAMPYYLMRHGTGMKATHIRIMNILRLIIETGLFTGLFITSSTVRH